MKSKIPFITIILLIGILLINSYYLLQNIQKKTELESLARESSIEMELIKEKELEYNKEITKLNDIIQKKNEENRTLRLEKQHLIKDLEGIENYSKYSYYRNMANNHTLRSALVIVEALKNKDIELIKGIYGDDSKDRVEILLEYSDDEEINNNYYYSELKVDEDIIKELFLMMDGKSGENYDDYYFIEDLHGSAHQNIIFKLSDSYLWIQFDSRAKLSKIRWTVEQPNPD